MRRALLGLLCLMGCTDVPVTVRSLLEAPTTLVVAAVDARGVVARTAPLPVTSTLPVRVQLGVGARREPLTVAVWGFRGGTWSGFGTAAWAPSAATLDVELIAPPVDTDEDGWPDDIDRCVFVADAEQLDADADGAGDACGCRHNRLDSARFDTPDVLLKWTVNDATVQFVDAGARVCPRGQREFSLVRTVTAVAPAAWAFTASVEGGGDVQVGPVLVQSGCDSWFRCHVSGLNEPTPGTGLMTLTTVGSVDAGPVDLELYGSGTGCFVVSSVCLEHP